MLNIIIDTVCGGFTGVVLSDFLLMILLSRIFIINEVWVPFRNSEMGAPVLAASVGEYRVVTTELVFTKKSDHKKVFATFFFWYTINQYSFAQFFRGWGQLILYQNRQSHGERDLK